MPLVMSTHYWVLVAWMEIPFLACVHTVGPQRTSRSSLAVNPVMDVCVLRSQPALPCPEEADLDLIVFSQTLALTPYLFAFYDCFCIGLGSSSALLLRSNRCDRGYVFLSP